MSGVDDLRKELPHILVLFALLLLLLVVLTRFKWVHASQVPGNWHDIYCGDICLGNSCFSLSGGKSRVALVYDDDAMGDWRTLERRITRERMFTLVYPVKASVISVDLLRDYELVILHNKHITRNQAKAVQEYLDTGGTVLWIADAASDYYLTGEELKQAEFENQSKPGWYDYVVEQTSSLKGFGLLADDLGAQYLGSENASLFEVKTVNKRHLIMASFPEGLRGFPKLPFVRVSPNPARTSILATITRGDEEFPAVLETKLGRVTMIYVAFPIENAGSGSKTLLQNVMDYLVVC
ncbi:MAG: hypothetical protein ACE5DI_01605 [Candidatus Micrarchaeia archaeon]